MYHRRAGVWTRSWRSFAESADEEVGLGAVVVEHALRATGSRRRSVGGLWELRGECAENAAWRGCWDGETVMCEE